MIGRVAVAISTTGHEHRIETLRRCVAGWDQALDAYPGSGLVVTVDGSEEDAQRVAEAVHEWTGSVFRVGQPSPFFPSIETGYGRQVFSMRDGRLGVAANKNTGIEQLMHCGVHPEYEHLFLSDDDAWPLFPQSLAKHIEHYAPHSMVCWGRNRFYCTQTTHEGQSWAEWTWPRGVVLYAHRSAIERVGGMDERFSPGGHEHVEWSQRINNAGLTPAAFLSPASYATRNAMGASALWHAEDMPRLGEPRHVFNARKREHTTLNVTPDDWKRIDSVMQDRMGSDAFVSYRAADNGRASATLCEYTPSLGAGEA